MTMEECIFQCFGESKPKVSMLGKPKVSMSKPKVSMSKPKVSMEYSEPTIYCCKYCNNEYAHKQSRFRHEKTCIERPEELISKSEVIELLKNKDEIIKELKSQLELALTKVGSNNNNINITINAYGKENTDYITNAFIQNLTKSGPYAAIPNLLREIHYNPNHKENQNVLIMNKKEKHIRTYDGNRWIYADKHSTLENMSNKAFYKLLENSDEASPNFHKFSDAYQWEEESVVKQTKESIELMILNSQNIEI